MSGQDAELEQLRHGISCAALLERGQPAWSLDKRGSHPARAEISPGTRGGGDRQSRRSRLVGSA